MQELERAWSFFPFFSATPLSFCAYGYLYGLRIGFCLSKWHCNVDSWRSDGCPQTNEPRPCKEEAGDPILPRHSCRPPLFQMPDDERILPIRRVDPNLPKVKHKRNMKFFWYRLPIYPHILADQLTGRGKLFPLNRSWHISTTPNTTKKKLFGFKLIQ